VDEVSVRPRREGSDELRTSGGPVSKKADSKLALSWKTDNPDKDELRYRLQYRLVGTATWYDLTRREEVLTKESYDWDTATLPEGRYRVRVVATDELSNPPDLVTRDDAESGIVLVDNTEPRIENLTRGAAREGPGHRRRRPDQADRDFVAAATNGTCFILPTASSTSRQKTSKRTHEPPAGRGYARAARHDDANNWSSKRRAQISVPALTPLSGETH
jgi:hypothetical protein